MDLEKNYIPNEFSLNTQKHGLINFSYLSVWRETLIIKNTKKINDFEPTAFCLIVAKYLISKKENIVYDEEYYKTIKTHNDIKLILEKEELNNFSKEFVSIYKTEISYYIDLDSNDNLDNQQIIQKYFFETNEEFIKLVEKTTRFTNLDFDKKLFDQVKKVSELTKITFPKLSSDELKRITQAKNNFSGISPEQITKYSEMAKNTLKFTKLAEINDIVENIQKVTSVNIPNLPPPPIVPHHVEFEVLNEIKYLFNDFIINFNIFKEYIKSMLEATNTSIDNIKDKFEKQNIENKKTSKIALFFSIAAIIIAVAVGIAQIIISLNSNKNIDKLNYSIEQLNNTIIDLNIYNKKNLEKIEILTNELILQNENKSQIEDNVEQTP